MCSGGKCEVKGKAEDNEEEEARESLVQELLRVADRFQAGGLYEHCLAEFGRTLTLETAIQQLVWAHARAPEGARAVAMEYVVANCRAIQVGYKSDVRMFSGVPGACTHVCRFALCVAHPALVHRGHGRKKAVWSNSPRRLSVARRCRRGSRCAAADLGFPCDRVQSDAGHTVALLQTLPADVFVAFLAAVNS